MQMQEKQPWIEGLSQSEGESCLTSLRMLSDQLDEAMNAMVQRKLTSLDHSIHMQQVICSRLADLRYRSAARLERMPAAAVDLIESDLAVKIKSAIVSLLALNDRYAALLKHSDDTLELIAGLYRSYTSFAQPASGQASPSGWSCDV